MTCLFENLSKLVFYSLTYKQPSYIFVGLAYDVFGIVFYYYYCYFGRFKTEFKYFH